MNPHGSSFSRHPLAQFAIAFAAGICAANYFPIGLVVLWIAGGVCTMAALIGLLIRRDSLAGVALLVAFGVAGAVYEKRDEPHARLKEFLGRQVILTGVLKEPPAVERDRLYLTLSVERLDVDGLERNVSGVVSLLAHFRSDDLKLGFGARVRVTTTLNRIDDYRNPGVSPLSEYLDRKGYDATGLIKSAAAITRLEDEHGLSVYALGTLYSWREKLQREIDTKFAPETAGVLDAALLGNRYNLSRETAERFREGGTFHVLVISGLHISFIGGVVFLVLSRLTKRHALQFAVSAAVVWAYSLAVGAEASVVRAALMFTFAGAGALLFRKSTSLNALGCAALFLLIRSPKELFDPSFQLTFLSVLAIVVIAWPLWQTCAAIGAWYPSRETPYPPACSRELRWFCQVLFWSEHKWQREIARSSHRYRLFKAPLAARFEKFRVQACLRYVFGAVVVSSAVQLVLLPLMIVYFHRLSLASLILNIVVSVLLAVLTAVALLALLLSQLSLALAAPLLRMADAFNWLMIHSVDPFTRSNLASIRLPEYSSWGAFVYVLYFVPLLALAFAIARWRPLVLRVERTNRWVWSAAFAQALLVAVIVFHPLSALPNGMLQVDFLDVGQGDAAVITMPDGRTLLVDGGGRPEVGDPPLKTDKRSIGEAVVSEYLWWRGLDIVDYVLATHADADHIDGLNDVLRNFTVNAAIVARSPPNDPEYAKFAQTLSTTSTQLATIQAGDVIRFGDVEMHVLWPPAAVHADEPSRNNDSVVLRVSLGKRSILLTGDVEKSAERALGENATELRADVVKVPHHGSKSSSTQGFVAATKAEFAIISVGQHSMFGHPHREVVERWEGIGARVLTTGKCGTITVTTDGKDLTVQPQRSTRSTKE
ncbi:MAG TPA: DNA internalization-related competence protein ComEC/Rec2 [Pyrinomonadaceae bacterium]|jgi:competence protein ComEC